MTESIESDEFERLRCVRVLKCFVSFKSIDSTIAYIKSLAVTCKLEVGFCVAVNRSIKSLTPTQRRNRIKESSQIRQSRNSSSFNAHTKVRPKKVTPFSNYNSLFLKTPIEEKEWFPRLSRELPPILTRYLLFLLPHILPYRPHPRTLPC